MASTASAGGLKPITTHYMFNVNCSFFDVHYYTFNANDHTLHVNYYVFNVNYYIFHVNCHTLNVNLSDDGVGGVGGRAPAGRHALALLLPAFRAQSLNEGS